MLNYGDVAFQAFTFSEFEFSSIDELLNKADKNYTFGGFAYDGSLKIQNQYKQFCSNCYYLIAVNSQTSTDVTLVAHALSSAVPIRPDRLIHDVLSTN